MEITEFIQRIAEELEFEETNLTPETKFRELDGWSSLSIMILVAFYDENFWKEINAATIKTCQTLQDLYNLSK